MPVTYDSYEAKVIEAGILMLANSQTFQALVGAIDVDTARDRIAEVDSGDPAEVGEGKGMACTGALFDLESAHASLGEIEFPVDRRFASHEARTGTVRAAILIPPDPAHAVCERYRHAMNIAGGIRADLVAQRGQPQCFADFAIDAQLAVLVDAGDRATGWHCAIITTTWMTP